MPQHNSRFHYHAQNLQDCLSAAILQPDLPYNTLLDQKIKSNNLSVKSRLEIYKNNVVGGLVDVVLKHYPTVSLLVGDVFARAMAREYVLGSPPKKANMNLYGADFPAFIAGFSPVKDLPYLVDVAHLEKAENDAYYAEEALILNADSAARYMRDILSGRQRIALHPSCSLLSSAYPLLALRAFAQAGQDKKDELCEQGISEGLENFDLDAGGQHLIVWRFGYRVEAIELNKAAYSFLDGIQKSLTLEQALDTALNIDPAFDFEAFFQDMILRDIFVIKTE